jgi:hypothetical protein
MKKLRFRHFFLRFIFTSALALILSGSLSSQIPIITSFTPASGPVGTKVTINGSNFSPVPTYNSVWFGAVQATVTAATSTSLVVAVPSGATYKPITVTVNGYTGYSRTIFNVTFPCTRIIDANAFPIKTDLPVGTGPFYGALSDIDGDGKPDLIISNNTSSNLSVFRNQSTSGTITTGSFAPKVDIGTGTNPFGIAVGDLDGDGKQDVVVANSGSNTISIFRNTSTSGSISLSSFAPKVDINTGTSPYGVAIGDLDGDGKPDLAVTNSTGNTVSLFRNTSTIGSISLASFGSRVDINTGNTPQNLAIYDINGDGKPEIIVLNVISNNIYVFGNSCTPGAISAAAFANRVDLTAGNYPAGLALGDIDRDGFTDLIVTNSNSNSVSVFRNTGVTGPISLASFAPKVDFPTGANPNGVSISDLDGDNKPDLVIGNYADNSVTVLRNTSTAGTITSTSFAPKTDYPAGTWPKGTIAGDLEGDGKPELVVINQNTNNISILRNTIAGPPVITSFSPRSGPIGTTVTINGSNFSSTAANNFVWFGAVKATVAAATSTTLTVSVPAGATYQPISVTVNGFTDYSNSPFIVTFPSSQLFNVTSFGMRADISTGTNPYCVAIHDIDGDGKPDILVTNLNSNTISIFPNISTSGSLTAGSFGAKVDLATGIMPYNIAVGDIDCDGKPDIAVTNYNGGTISVFRNASTAGSITASSFGQRVDLNTGTNPFGIAIGDIDGDGKPDIIVTSPGSLYLSVFQNIGTTGSITAGTFAPRVDITTSAPLYGLAFGDIDGDGKPDLSAVSPTTNVVWVFRNISLPGTLSTSSLETPVDFPTGIKPYSIALGDIDGDGKPDIATANNTGNTISVLRNISSPGSITSGSLSGNVDYPTGLNPYLIAIADIDGDGKPDVANGYNSGGSFVSILKNTSSSGTMGPGSIAPRYDVTTQSAPYGIAFGDLDGDGKPDLVAANYSSSTISVLRNTLALPPSAPVVGTITQPTCLLTTGSVILSGLPSSGSWTITRSPGGTTTNGTGTSTTVSGLSPGTYTFTVTTVSNGVSAASSNVVILTAKTGRVPVIKSKWRDLLICSNVGDSIVSYQWYIGNTPITGAKSQTYWSKKVAGVYKVVTVDKSGCTNTSNTVQITGTKSFSVYPNPARDIINVSLNDEPTGNAVILLHNATGKLVLRLETNKEFDELLEEIPVSALDPGIYYLKVTINQVNVYNSKVVLIK